MKKEKELETTSVKTLEIPNKALSLLYALLNVPLHGPQLRARNAFAKIIRDRLGMMENERVSIMERAAKKDPTTGAPLVKNAGEQNEEYDIDPADLEKSKKEYATYMEQKWTLALDATIKQSVVLVRPLILESKLDLGTVDGYVYEDICTAFEAI